MFIFLPVLQAHVWRFGVSHLCEQQWDIADSSVRTDLEELWTHRGGPLAERTCLFVLWAFASQWHRAKPERVTHSSDGVLFLLCLFFPQLFPFAFFLLVLCEKQDLAESP